jgi:tripartite-type tricarboxylate transporter receptor subunit TctC
MQRNVKRMFVAALAAGAALASSSAARAAGAGDFYAGKTLTMYTSGSSGGGYDLYARLLANHMGDHIPGHPKFVVKNAPGAGGIILANLLNAQAARDGTELAGIHSSAMMKAITGNKNVRYKPADFGWLGSITQEWNVCLASAAAHVRTAADAKAREILIGAVTSTPTESTPVLLNQIAGAKFKIVRGYPNTNEVNLAIERGEVQGICNGYNTVLSSMPEALRDKKVDIFLQLGATKNPDLPNVSFVYDLVKKPDDLALLDFEMGRLMFGRPFLTPPGVPAERLKILRDAFWATMQDKAFLADAQKQSLDVSPVDGAAVAEQIVKLQHASPAVIKRSAEINK